MKKNVSIIVGGTGQFGINLSNCLIERNEKVIVTSRNPKKKVALFGKKKVYLIKLNVLNKNKIKECIQKYSPNKIFYFAGQSSPVKSFKFKNVTFKSNYIGCKNFLEIIKILNIDCKFLNASSCEMYGNIKNKINLRTKKIPLSPYGKSKLKSFNVTKLFRDKYKMKTYNAIIFNSESYERNRDFLIPKICIAAINAFKSSKRTEFGNLSIAREWNWCLDQCQLILKFIKKKPQDFILSNGKSFTAKQMLEFAFKYFNLNYKNFVNENKVFYRKKEVMHKKSDFKACLRRNKIKRNNRIFGKKLIIKMIKFYLNE